MKIGEPPIIAAWIIIALVIVQRLAELFYAERNTRKLLARGAHEAGRSHYPLFIILHAAWLLSVTLNVHGINWRLIGIFVLLQLARIWVIATLGPYWTTRILTLPHAPLIRTGPYRFIRHPNYIIVICEVAILPLAFGETTVAIIFTLLNLVLITRRISQEERALAPRRLD